MAYDLMRRNLMPIIREEKVNMKHALVILIGLGCFSCLHAGEIETHVMESEYQLGKQEIHVLLPDNYEKTHAYRVLYVLPVEKGFDSRFGYGLGVLKELNAHNTYNLIIVQMGFEKEPWFGDHATDPNVRQASYVKAFVVPFIEKSYATLGTPEGRLLLGFSKSGWGAFSLILKHPEYFGYAAAWDAPITFESFHYGMKTVYGTPEQLTLYRPDLLVPKQRRFFEKQTRLVLTGNKDWGKETVSAHQLLDENGLKHHYDNTLAFPHRWNKGWMEPTLSVLMTLTENR